MSHGALACVCEREALADSGSAAELAVGHDFERAKVVFIGRMVSHTGVEQHFEVARVLKGDTTGAIVLHQGAIDADTGTRVLTSCEYEFELGKEYLVYAFDVGGSLSTSYCSRTRLLDRAELDLRLIEH